MTRLALGLENRFHLGDVGVVDLKEPLLAFGLHLPRHRRHQFRRRCYVLDLDSLHLDAPGRGGAVNDGKQLGVDAIALGQQFVEGHRPHDGADVGHHEVQYRDLQIADFVRCLWCVEHLIEDDRVDGRDGVVARDDGLLRDFEHGLHHVQPRPDPVDDRDDEGEAGFKRADVATESLDRPFVSLRNRFDRHGDENYGEHDDEENKDGKRAEHGAIPPIAAMSPRWETTQSNTAGAGA